MSYWRDKQKGLTGGGASSYFGSTDSSKVYVNPQDKPGLKTNEAGWEESSEDNTSTTDTEGASPTAGTDNYSNFLDKQSAAELLKQSNPNGEASPLNMSDADMQLMRTSGVKSFGDRDYERYGPINRMLRWGSSGLKKENRNDYYSNNLKNAQDNKSKGIINQAQNLGITMPEGDLFADEHKLLNQTQEKIKEYKGIQSDLKNNLGIDVTNVQEHLDSGNTALDEARKNVPADVQAIVDSGVGDLNTATKMVNATKQKQGWDDANANYDTMIQGLKDDAADVKDREAAQLKGYNEYGSQALKDAGNQYNTLDPQQFDNLEDAKAYYDEKSVDTGEKVTTNKLQKFLPFGKTGEESVMQTPFEEAMQNDLSMNKGIDKKLENISALESRGYKPGQDVGRDEKLIDAELDAGNKYFEGGLKSQFGSEEIEKIKDAGLKDHIKQNIDSGKNINELTKEYQAGVKSAADTKSQTDFDTAQTLFNTQNQKRRDDKAAADEAARQKQIAEDETRRKTNELAGWNQQLVDDMGSGNLDKYGTQLFEEHGDAEKYFKKTPTKSKGMLAKAQRFFKGGKTGMDEGYSQYDADVVDYTRPERPNVPVESEDEFFDEDITVDEVKDDNSMFENWASPPPDPRIEQWKNAKPGSGSSGDVQGRPPSRYDDVDQVEGFDKEELEPNNIPDKFKSMMKLRGKGEDINWMRTPEFKNQFKNWDAKTRREFQSYINAYQTYNRTQNAPEYRR